MAGRRRIRNVRKDKKVFSSTAARKNVKNLPGHNLMRGGICL